MSFFLQKKKHFGGGGLLLLSWHVMMMMINDTILTSMQAHIIIMIMPVEKLACKLAKEKNNKEMSWNATCIIIYFIFWAILSIFL